MLECHRATENLRRLDTRRRAECYLMSFCAGLKPPMPLLLPRKSGQNVLFEGRPAHRQRLSGRIAADLCRISKSAPPVLTTAGWRYWPGYRTLVKPDDYAGRRKHHPRRNVNKKVAARRNCGERPELKMTWSDRRGVRRWSSDPIWKKKRVTPMLARMWRRANLQTLKKKLKLSIKN